MITIVCYFLILIALAVIGAKLRLLFLTRHQRQPLISFSTNINDSLDKNIDNLYIEGSGMVSTQLLARRGSWRIALDQVMTLSAFEDMKAEEYGKML